MKRSENETLLYFIAILTPNHVSNAITTIKQHFKKTYGIKKALNSPPHITIYPPFRWRLSEVEVLNTFLRNFIKNYSPFPVHIKDYGAFQNRVIYLSITENYALQSLGNDLTMWMTDNFQLGSGADKNSMHPHITVAFRDLTPEIFNSVWPKFKNKSFEMSFVVNQLALLKHTGKRWEIVRFFPFKTNNRS